MKIVWLSLLFVAVQAGSAGTEEPPDNEVTPGLRNGLLFQPRGPLTLATGVWTTVVRFRQHDVRRQADQIRQQMEQIDQALEDASGQNLTYTPEGVRSRNFIAEVRKMWQRERAWMEAEIRAGEAEIYELRSELAQGRRARGLINAFGEGLKWLFGTSTEGDVERLHKHIKEIEVGMGKLHHVAELQTTIIGSISQTQKKNAKNLITLARKVIELEQSLTHSLEAGHLTMVNIRHELDFTQAVSSAIRTASAAVMTFHHEVIRITRAMAHTQQGVITPALLPPASLWTILAAIPNHLPDGWAPAVSLSDTPANAYKVLGLDALVMEDGWDIHIQIPLQLNPYSKFDLYEVTAVPTFMGNSSMALQTQIATKFFAISSDQRLHLEADRDVLEQCRRAGGRTICQEITPLIKGTRDGCLYHSFRDDQKKAAEECRRVVVKPKPDIYHLDEEKWVYVLPKEETFSLQCAGGHPPSNGFRLKGAGVFSLPLGCTAMGDAHIIPAHLRRRGKQAKDLRLEDMTHFAFHLGKKEYEALGPKSSSEADPELLELVKQQPENDVIDATLEELRKKMGEWDDKQNNGWSPTEFVSHTSLSLGATNTLVIVILLIYGCKKGRRTRDEDGPRLMVHQATAPTTTLPTAPFPFSEFQVRLARLEAVTRELQFKADRAAHLEAMLKALEKRHEQLMETMM